MSEQCHYQIRTAQQSDADTIYKILFDCREEIPVNLDGDKRKTITQNLVNKCCANRWSLIAVNVAAEAVGFVLLEEREVASSPNGVVIRSKNISYGAVTESERKNGIFSGMIEKVIQQENVPLYAEVLNENKIKDHIKKVISKCGFKSQGTTNDREYFIWEKQQ